MVSKGLGLLNCFQSFVVVNVLAESISNLMHHFGLLHQLLVVKLAVNVSIFRLVQFGRRIYSSYIPQAVLSLISSRTDRANCLWRSLR